MINLTLYSRAQIIKTFIISQFIFVCSAIATPQSVYRIVNSLIFKFNLEIEIKKIEKNPYDQRLHKGGLNIPDFETMVKTAQIKWIKRIKDSHTYYWKLILKLYLAKLNVLKHATCATYKLLNEISGNDSSKCTTILL